MGAPCVVEACDLPRHGLGYCSKHYTRLKRYGDVSIVRQIKGPASVRLKAVLDALQPDETGCWLWPGAKDALGYGRFKMTRQTSDLAHRVVYEVFKGPIPENLTIDHLCRVRHCINPEHLEAVTMRTNILRGVGLAAQNAKKTHCVRGHLFDEKNTRLIRRGTNMERSCRICHRERVRAFWARKRKSA